MTHVDGAAVALSALAAVCLAVASTLQHRAVGQVPVGNALDPRLVLAALRRPDWLAGGGATVLGVVLETAALRVGPVSLVQPILGLGLPMAVVLGPLLVGGRPEPGDVALALACAAGVSGLVVLAAPSGGSVLPTTRGLVSLAVLTVVALALAGQAPRGGGLQVAAAAAVLLGTASVALRPLAAGLGSEAPGALGAVAGVLVVAAAGALLTSQAGFQRTGLALALTVVTLGEPVTAVALAVGVLHERLHVAGPRGAFALACAAVALAATAGMARRAGTAQPEPVR